MQELIPPTLQQASGWAAAAAEYLDDAARGRDPKIQNLYGAKDFLRLAAQFVDREIEAMEGGQHVCSENPVPYTSDGALGHGWECGVCGAFLQAG